MKNIAIFASGSGESARRVVSLFNEGNRIRVSLVVTDRENAEIIELLQPLGIETVFMTRERLRDDSSELLALLKERGVELIALDDFKGILPESVESEYAGKVVTLTGPEEAPIEVVNALERPAAARQEINLEKKEPKSVDEEWAETLKIDFDESRVRTTPPPIPSAQPTPAGPTPAQPASPQVNATAPNGMQGTPFNPTPAQGESPMPSTYMIWSVLATVFCCFIPGIVAIIFSSQVSTRYIAGDIQGARQASDRAQIWIIVSFVLGLLTSTLYLPIMLIS